MVDNDPLVILPKAKAAVIAATGVSLSHKLIHVVLITQGYSRKEPNFTRGHFPLKSQLQNSWNSADDMKHTDIRMFFPVDRTCFG